MYKFLLTLLLLSITALAANDATVKGTVLDPSGASVPNARIRVLDEKGNTVVETKTGSDGSFAVNFPAGSVSLVVFAPGFKPHTEELDLSRETTTNFDINLKIGCSGEVARFIPKEFDLRHLLIEIHYWGAFGDCPEKTYRLWGTGYASATYAQCGGKSRTATRFIEAAELERALTSIANHQSGPICDYYPGGIDAPTVSLTLYYGSDPNLVITHDAADKIPNVMVIEQELERLIDPEHRLKEFEKAR